MGDVVQDSNKYLVKEVDYKGKDITVGTPLEDALVNKNAPVNLKDYDGIPSYQFIQKDGKIDIYEYTKNIDGSVSSIRQYEAPNNFAAQEWYKKQLSRRVPEGTVFSDASIFQFADSNEAGFAKSKVKALQQAGLVAFHGEDDKEAWSKFQADLDKANKEYYAQFQDKLGSMGAQIFLIENIRQLVLNSLNKPPNVGWRINGKGATAEGKEGEKPKKAGLPYGLKALSCHNPESLIHFMMNDNKKQLIAFQNGTPAMFSALIPQVMLFLIDADGNELAVPFSMHKESLNSGDPTKLLMGREGRGDDVGLVSFDWNFTGGKSAVAFSSGGMGSGTGQASLNIFFENAASIIKKRKVLKKTKNGLKQVDFSYEELLAKSVTDKNNNEIRFANQGRIRAIIKYGVDKSFAKTIPKSAEFFEAAEDMAIVLNLSPAQYELEFSDSGGVNLIIEYQHSVEVFLQDPKLNIFSGKIELVKQKYEELLKQFNAIKDELEGPEQQKGSKRLAKARALVNKAEDDVLVAQNEVYGNLKSRILSVAYKKEFKRGSLENYLTVRQMDRSTRIAKLGTSEYGRHWYSKKEFEIPANPFANYGFADEDGTALQGSIEDTGTEDMHWIYFGDILDAVLNQEGIKQQLQSENMSIILGQVMIPEVLRGVNGTEPPQSVALNLADIPIALEIWNQFFTEHIVKPKIVNLDLFAFIRKMILDLIHPILNNKDIVGKGNLPRTSSVQLNFYTGKKEKLAKLFTKNGAPVNRVFVNNITEAYLGTPVDPNPIGKKDKGNICFIAGSFDHNLIGISNLVGNEQFDQKLGIMHYYLARDRGFVKSASFVKSPVPRSREINVAQSISGNETITPKTLLWEPFNANLEMFGNPNVRMGSVYFLQPTLPGIGAFSDRKSAAYKLQIGGYHRVTELTNKITPQGWETSVVGLRQDPVSGKLADPEVQANKVIYPKGRVDFQNVNNSEAGTILS